MPIYRLQKDSLWMPDASEYEENDIVAVGGDLSVERLILAYRLGIFPWYNDPSQPIWYNPLERAVLFVNNLKISDSMRAVIRKDSFSFSFDCAFRQVMEGCRGGDRTGNTWMHDEIVEVYCKLHEIGFAHSVEVWHQGTLVGGLYGMSMGRVFYGESMFSNRSNASKFGFIQLVKTLEARGFEWVDCQVMTSHLASLGAEGIERHVFLELLDRALDKPTWNGPWTAYANSNKIHLPQELFKEVNKSL
jgi:leucyl/phenylalanyl-tRNA---protein transferase